MLPKYYYLKAPRGSSTNSPRETLSSLTRSLPSNNSGARAQTPPERRYHRSRDHYLQSTRGLEHKLPPRDAIIAHAITTSKALGGSSANSPRETLSSLTRSLPQKHLGSRAQTSPERCYHRSRDHYLKSTRGLERKLPS